MNKFTRQFEICARALIISDNKILICHGKKNGHYFFPGGHIELGESAEIALAREIKEELKAKIIKSEYIGTIENIYQDNGYHHEFNLVFNIKVDKIPRETPEDHIKFDLVDLNKFKKMKILPVALQKSILLWLKNKKRFWASQLYEKTIL